MTVTTATVRAELGSLDEVAEGVFAYVQPDGGWCLNNAGLLVGARSAVLIDSAATRRRADALAAAVAGASSVPVDVLVNTHSHGDHTFGNRIAAPRARVVAQRHAAREMDENALALQGLWSGVEWGIDTSPRADVTFDQRLELGELAQGGPLDVRALHNGAGHTPGDAVVWLPGPRVLFTGDLVFSGATPFVLMGTIDGALRQLEWLRRLSPLVVVPGHGPVGGPELLDANADYLRWVRALAVDGLRDGLDPLTLAQGASLGRFGDLLDSERLVPNLVRAYAELQAQPWGTAADVVGAFGQMIEFHGGLPLCSA